MDLAERGLYELLRRAGFVARIIENRVFYHDAGTVIDQPKVG